ncbi:MAG: ATP-dependent DNA helicase UvrD2 [Spirochaetes bacterium ADurb.BinA120]|nr:MAG: ATP-dependent DNA helicase UvrD2 [Spirochaetes bacterium ADurb.BinA120]
MGIFERYGKWIDSKPWHTAVAVVLHMSIVCTAIYVGAWACVEPFKPEGMRYTWSEWRDIQKNQDAPIPTKTWREQGVPAYVILHDRTLKELAEMRPTTRGHLAMVTGIGAAKIEHYGDELVRLIADH